MRLVLRTVTLVLAAASFARAQPASRPTRELFLFLFRPGPAWVAGRPMSRQDLRAHGAYHAALVRGGAPLLAAATSA